MKTVHYRYTGKERDEESGLYYHGARYYIPWLARWTAVDPLENKYAAMSPYNYSFNNPVVFNDPSGMEGEEVVGNVTLSEVTITAQDFKEGEQRNKEALPSDAPISLQQFNRQRFHLGSEGHKRGWYSESDYVSMNSGVMLGLIASQDPNILQNGNPGVGFFISRVAEQTLNFVEKNQGKISPDFLTLMSERGAELVKNFKEAHGDVIYPSAFDPIADLLPAIILGLSKGLIEAGTAISEGIAKSTTQMSLAVSRELAVESIESTLKNLAKGDTYARVGRWMSQVEYDIMKTTGRVVEGGGGQTFVSINGIEDFMKQTSKGSVYAEFEVPKNSLIPGGKEGWFKMIGPNANSTMQKILNKQGGEMLPFIKNLSPIMQTK